MAEQQQEVTAYCVKCREKRVMKDRESITMKNGKPASKGTCPTCVQDRQNKIKHYFFFKSFLESLT